jgi:surface antigen
MIGKFAAVAGLSAVLALGAAVAPAQAQNKDLFGALLGGVGGAVAGAQFGKGTGQLVGVAAGTLLGAAVGHSVGQSLDRADAGYAGPGYTQSYSTGYAPTYYYEPPPRRHYRPRPVYYAPPPPPAYYPPHRYYGAPASYEPAPAQPQQFCREYQSTITVGGRQVPGFGQACMQPDGSWQMGPLQPEQ